MNLFNWPKAAAFDRVVPKSRIYEHAGVDSVLKERFVQQVEQINWAYKLAPETVNLPANKGVAEIQVFRIALKSPILDLEVLRAIDKAIPFPLIYELAHGGRVRMVAAWKRVSEAGATPKVVGRYFESAWQHDNTPRLSLPVAVDMAGLYERLLSSLVDGSIAEQLETMAPTSPLPVQDVGRAVYTVQQAEPRGEALSLDQRIALAEAVTGQQKHVERLTARLGREKQFNKRVAINAELRDAKLELQRLAQQQAAALRS